MSAYKTFTNKDVTITPFRATRGYTISGNSLTGSISGLDQSSGYGIDFLFGTLDSSSFNPGLTYGNVSSVTNITYPYEQIPDWSNQKMINHPTMNSQWTTYVMQTHDVGNNHSSLSQSQNYVGFVKPTKNGPLVHNTKTVYSSIKHLYYSNYTSGSKTVDLIATRSIIPGANASGDDYKGYNNSPQYENFNQSTLLMTRSFGEFRNNRSYYGLGGNVISVISIPHQVYGDFIEPQSFRFQFTQSTALTGKSYAERFRSYDVTDDGEGNIISSSGLHVGNIFYEHGIIVFTPTGQSGSDAYSKEYPIASLKNTALDMLFKAGPIYPDANATMPAAISESSINSSSVSFTSSFSITENQYKCVIGEGEFGYSLNPSLLTGSLGYNNNKYWDFATGSYFSPYITTVGLYNDNKELLVVGKLSTPIKSPMQSDLTIQINFDT